jgi:hypothetical protein
MRPNFPLTLRNNQPHQEQLLGLGTKWVDIPGTASSSSTNLLILPGNAAVF